MSMKRVVIIAVVTVFILCSCGKGPQLPKLDRDGVVLAFGDSITYGTGARSGESYPAVLQQMIKRKVVNAGVPGELSEQGLLRLPVVLNKYQPKLLILCHGGNDILRSKDLDLMEANVEAMVRLAQERGVAVVLLGVPRISLFLSVADQFRTIAEVTDVVFIADLVADILDDKSLKSDAIHPNDKGYRKMAEQIYSELQNSGAI
jgi:lysophospholipase L1-like esterase